MSNVLKLDKLCVNRNVLRSLRKIMQNDYPEVLQTFLDESLSHYSQIHGAFEAEDFHLLKIVSGLFRDSCASVGAEYLSELAGKVEQQCRSGHYQGIDEIINEIDSLYESNRNDIRKEQEKHCSKLAS